MPTTTVTTEIHISSIQPSPPTTSIQLETLPVDTTNESVPTPEERTYPTGPKFWLTTLSLVVVITLSGLDTNIVATAVPAMTDEFHTVSDIGWYSSAFRLTAAAFQFIFGKLYANFSTKRIFILSNLIFLLGSLLCATAPKSFVFVLARAVTGVGFAGNLAGCFAALIDILPLHRRPMYAGVMACIESLAIISAPIVGGLLTQRLGWRWCFWINLPIGAVSLLGLVFVYQESEHTVSRGERRLKEKITDLDVFSNCIFIPCLTALFLALSWAGTRYEWKDGRVVGLFVVCGVLFAAFMYNQHRRGDTATLPLRILFNRNVMAGFIYTMCTNSMTNVLEYYLPTYYQIVRGATPAESGIRMIPILAGMAVGLLLQGFGTSVVGYYAPFMLFASICMPVFTGLLTMTQVGTNLAQVMIFSGLVGFSGGLGFQGPQSAVQATLPDKDVNIGIGILLFGQSFGPAVAIAIAQVIFTNQLASNIGKLVPGLSSSTIQNNGLSGLRLSVPPAQWEELRAGVDLSLTRTWYITVALACMTMVGSLMIEWRSIKQKQS